MSTDATAEADTDADAAADADSEPELLDRWLDWLIGGFLVVAGLAGALIGWLLASAASPEWARSIAAEVEMEPEVMTRAELADVIHQVGFWGGTGLAVTGLASAALGVGFWIYRTRRRRRPNPAPDAITPALLGALVTIFASFVPFSSLLGGGVAGWIARDGGSGLRTGALAGLVAVAPGVTVAAFVIVGTMNAGLGGIGVLVGLGIGFWSLLTIALSTVGGYVGDRIADDGAPSI